MFSFTTFYFCNIFMFPSSITSLRQTRTMTNANSKPVILLIGGGWHTPASYKTLVDALQAAGHEVYCPDHPSMNQTRPPIASLTQDSASLRSYAQPLVDKGHRVVAVMHSYGGQVGTDSLYGLGMDSRSEKGLPGGVSNLVYVTAFALPEGGSMVGKVKEMGHEALIPIAFDFADDRTVLCRDPKTQLVGDELDEEALEEYLGSLQRWNGQCMYDPISHAAWKEIPVTYVYTTNDMTVPLDYQKSMVTFLEQQGISVKTYTLETGHCPNITAADGLVKIINEVADFREG